MKNDSEPTHETALFPEVQADPAATATEPAAETPKPKVTGSFDGLRLGKVFGWVRLSGSSEAPAEVDLVVDGRVVSRHAAGLFRGDLLAAKVGTGHHGFEAELPRSLFDGNQHEVEIREASTGQPLAGSPRTFSGLSAARYELYLEGSALSGWSVLPGHDGRSLDVHVLKDGKKTAIGEAVPDGAPGERLSFRIPLPVEAFDGSAHTFSVVAEEPPWVLGQTALILPGALTPADALQRFARDGLTPALSTVPGFRYESLAQALAALQQSSPASTLPQRLAQLLVCHEALVKGANEAARQYAPLTFPVVESPKVSIVIPVHNKFAVTYHCLASLLLAVNNASFEVILIDDGSQDMSLRLPELVSGITYMRNEEAQGFVRACNRAAELSRGEFIVMLNNDTEVTCGWLDELLWPFEHFSAVGMTGAKLLYPDGKLQEAGGIVWNTGDPWNYGRFGNAKDPRYNYTRQVDYLSGACILLPAALWKELKGFDEEFAPAYFEDTDLAFRVRERGLKTVYTPMAQVVHFEGVSSGTSTASGMKRFQEVNRPKFKRRWGLACRGNGKVGVDLELAKDRNVTLRALVIDVEPPQPDKNAGGYAAVQEMRMLQALGFKCTFVPMNMAWLGHYTAALQRMGVECLYSPFIQSVNDVIEHRGSEFDLVYITRYNVAEQCVDAVRKHAPQAKLVLNNADLHFLRELRAGLAAGSREVISRSTKTRDAELAVMRKVDLVLTYTDVEQAVILSHNLDSTRVARCPWVAKVSSKAAGFEGRRDIAFLGGFNHHPNAEAVQWFALKVLPLLRAELPDVRLKVYGSFVPKSLEELAEEQEGLVIEGWVPSVDEVYDTCRVFVAPLRSGAGIKGKVIDALARGVPSVLSPLAAEGVPVRDGVDAMIADAPEAWVKAIVTLYGDAARWAAMSSQAMSLATERFGFEKGVAEMQEALRQVEVFTETGSQTLALQQ